MKEMNGKEMGSKEIFTGRAKNPPLKRIFSKIQERKEGHSIGVNQLPQTSSVQPSRPTKQPVSFSFLFCFVYDRITLE